MGPEIEAHAVGAWWIRLLVGLYPEAFRREFGREMTAVFVDEARTRTGHGTMRTAWFWMRTTGVTLWCALAEHATSTWDHLLLDSLPERDAARQRRFDTFSRQLMTDVRQAIEEVERRPWRSAAVVGLAAGIAAVALAAVGVGRAGLWHLPYPEPHRLVSIETAFHDLNYESFPLSPFEFLEIEKLSSSYEAIGAWAVGTRNVKAGSHPTRERVLWATSGVFEALGLDRPDTIVPGQPRPVYATAEFVEAYFAGGGSALGEILDINGRPARIAGILPADSRFWVAEVSLWFPFVPDPPRSLESSHVLGVVARLKSGSRLEDAQREVADIGAGWSERHAELHGPAESHPFKVRPLRQALIGGSGPPFRLLLASAAGLLLLALLHIPFVGRGAGRSRRPASEFIERALLVTTGGTVGIGVALAGLLAWSQAGLGPFSPGQELGATGLLTFFGLTLAAAVAATFSLLRLSPAARLGGTLLVLDVAVAIALLVGAGLLTQSVSNLRAVDPGFVPAGLLAFDAGLPSTEGVGRDSVDRMADRVMEFAGSLPGVTDVAMTSSLPVSPDLLPSDLDGRSADDLHGPLRHDRAYIHFVSAGYTKVMGIPLAEGRRIRGGLEAIVSTTLARRLWPNGDAIGRQVRPSYFTQATVFATVVGIVDDVAQTTLVEGEAAQLYVSRDLLPASAKAFLQSISVVVRTTDEPGTMYGLPLHLALGGQAIPVSRPRHLDARTRTAIRDLSLLLRLLTVAAALCLALGLITARISAAQWTGWARSLASKVALGTAGGLLLAVTVRAALDPLLFKTDLADVPIAVGATLCLIGWFAAAMRFRKVSDSA